MADPVLFVKGVSDMPRPGRHRPAPLVEPAGWVPPVVDDVEARLLGHRRSMRPREASAKARVSLSSARKFWHALGFPNVEDEDTVFTEADRVALQSLARLVREGVFDEPTALAMTRAFARTTDRLAMWQVQLMAEAIGELSLTAGAIFPDSTEQGAGAEGSGEARAGWTNAGRDDTRGMPDSVTARAAAVKLADLADDLEPLLIYAWRRNLSAAISRMVTDAEPIDNQPGVVRCVGFADLVAFTRLVGGLSERELARVVQRFEALAFDVVTAHSGRVVKTVGDEVLFVAMGAAPAAAIALDLVEAMAEDEVLPDVRVGMASGRVISRLGDIFGNTVNRASRLTAVARPGTVVVDAAIARSISSSSGFEMSQLSRTTLRGIGPVTPWLLRRAGQAGRGGPPADAERADDDLTANGFTDNGLTDNGLTDNELTDVDLTDDEPADDSLSGDR